MFILPEVVFMKGRIVSIHGLQSKKLSRRWERYWPWFVMNWMEDNDNKYGVTCIYLSNLFEAFNNYDII